MSIETTININIGIDEKLSRAATRTGVSKKNLISSLLRRLSMDFEQIAVPWKRISYQKRDAGKKWKPVHLNLMPDEYEFFNDLRKGCKMSISYLVVYALDKYLDEVMNEICEGSDNYRYSNYTLSYVIYDGIVCLIHYWGMAKIPLSRYFLKTLSDHALNFSSA
jgi:hypothetical protein